MFAMYSVSPSATCHLVPSISPMPALANYFGLAPIIQVWLFCYFSRVGGQQGVAAPVAVLPYMPAAFMLYTSDFCYFVMFYFAPPTHHTSIHETLLILHSQLEQLTCLPAADHV